VPQLTVLQISDMARLLRASRFSLDRLIRRANIPSTVRHPKWGRAIFTVEDVPRFALAYWLFRSGLRTRAVRDVLTNGDVDAFMQKLVSPDAIEAEAENVGFLVTWRVQKTSGTAKRNQSDFDQQVVLARDFKGIQRILGESNQFGFLVVPIGGLMNDLAGRLRKYLQKIEE
jgi:hypothetical protein